MLRVVVFATPGPTLEPPIYKIPPSLDDYGRQARTPYPATKQTRGFLVSCVDPQTNIAVADCEVELIQSAPVANSGGHDHDDPTRPKGTIVPRIGSTGSAGVLSVIYTAPRIAGEENVTVAGTVNGVAATPAVFQMKVGVEGLVELPPLDFYELIGRFGEPGVGSRHTSIHFGTPTMNSALINLAAMYLAAFPDRQRLRYNDMSLRTGGILDVLNNWQTPHSEHRFGVNADLDVSAAAALGAEQLRRLPRLMRHAGLGPPHEEGNHWHLRLRGY